MPGLPDGKGIILVFVIGIQILDWHISLGKEQIRCCCCSLIICLTCDLVLIFIRFLRVFLALGVSHQAGLSYFVTHNRRHQQW